MEFFDCHCHTERSACVEDVDLLMYRRIAARSGRVFCVTDHSAHLFYPPDRKWAFWEEGARDLFRKCQKEGLARCQQYVAELRAVQTGGMLVGVELDVLPGGVPVFDPALLSELDLVLGAIHAMRSLKRHRPLADAVAEHKARFLELCELGVHAVAHPFREWRVHQCPVPDELLTWTVETAAQAGVALELNCHYRVPDCDLPMVQLCVEAGVPIAIGTDTHRSYEFGDFTYHEQILRQADLGEDRWPQVLLRPPLPRARPAQ